MTKHVIELKVNYHPGGNFTLSQKLNTEVPEDLKGSLFANSDKGEFYRAVARKLAELAANGSEYRIIYKDAPYQDDPE